jgi:putative membrane protein
LRDQNLITHGTPARNFRVTLVALGILMLIGGLIYHVQFMVHLREERKAMAADGLIHAQSGFPFRSR